tara:strand:+ start:1101 stop:1634 length:534 start_codon:yes stop_codon:yes gene_type:complete
MANSNSITNFKKGFNGGTRSNRFEVKIVDGWPGMPPATNDTTFKIVATQFPIAQVNTITIPYRGRPVNYAGDRQYSPWSITVYDDSNTNNLWKSFNRWKELMDGHKTHVSQDYTHRTLQKKWEIYQYDMNGAIIRHVQLQKCWPSVVSQIDLNMSSTDLVSFTVQMVFDKINYVKGI